MLKTQGMTYMVALLSPSAKQQFFDNAGQLAAGYRLYTYVANTTTPQATYSDRAGTIPNANPVILDARGECTLYLPAGLVYDYVLKTAADALVWTREDVMASAGEASAVTFLQTGTGAVVRTVTQKLQETVSVKDFGAVGDGIANDTAAFNAALAAADDIFVPAGTYNAAGIVIPQNKRLTGDGKFKSIIRPTFSSTYGVRLIIGAEIRDIGVNGNNQVSHCFEINGDYTKIHECHAQYAKVGGAGDGAGYYNVNNDTWEMIGTSSDNCRYSFYNANRGINVVIDRHSSRGADYYGLYWTYSTQQPQGMRIKNGLFFGNDFAIYFAKDSFNVQIDAIIDGCNQVGIFLEEVVPNTSTDYVITCPFITAVNYGIQIRGGHNHIIIDNGNVSNASNGIFFEANTTNRCENVTISNSTFGNNSNNAISVDSVSNCLIIGCDFAAAGGATDIAIGATYTAGAKPPVYIKNCSFKKTNSVVATNTRVRECVGHITRNEGLATLPASASNVMVNHGMARQPTWLMVSSGGNVGVVWWSDLSPTQFRIKASSPAGVPVPITWQAGCDA